MQCVILAGGLATRMRSFTQVIPKSLIPVKGIPFIDYQLKWLELQGVTEALFCIGYQGQMIQDHIGDGRRWKLKISFVNEGEHLLGTAGALRLALDEGVLPESFLLTYGDSFLPTSFSRVWQAFQMGSLPALMTIFHNEGKWDSSNVWYEAGKIKLYEKGHAGKTGQFAYIDYGLSAMRRSLIEELVVPGEKQDLSTIFKQLSQAGRLAAWEVKNRFYEIGSPAGLEDFETFASGKFALREPDDLPVDTGLAQEANLIALIRANPNINYEPI